MRTGPATGQQPRRFLQIGISARICTLCGACTAETPLGGSKRKGSADEIGGSETKKQRKGLYFEFAKKKWENEDSFKLPDGTYWCGLLPRGLP